MNYAPKVFTREHPCTKVEIQNCFYRSGAYIPRLVIEAQTEIGLNVPKYLIREDFAEVKSLRGADYYVLTVEGKAWLSKGLLRFLELHPERALDCRELPAGYSTGGGRKTPAKPIKELQSRGPVLRRTRK